METNNRTITFIYSDSSEKQMFEIIGAEAIKRGYKIKYTTNKFAKCDIGFYCQHINHPENSKFSIIMLHDITQQYLNWPDIWFNEPWNKYDIGFLPSLKWEKNWLESSEKFYTRPRIGCFIAGWPKADPYIELDLNKQKEHYKKKFGLDLDKPTILYAPAWENDNKEDDFVQSMLRLDVNVLIKQAPFDRKKYRKIVENIEKMEKQHKGIDKVTILSRETNIIEAIIACDILVSEESSTMSEAVMMGKPAVSVSNWLIPDTKPSRFPSSEYDFVTKTTKENLTYTIDEMIKNYEYHVNRAVGFSKEYFGQKRNSSKTIMDILDSVLKNGDSSMKLTPKSDVPPTKEELFAFKKVQKKRLFLDKFIFPNRFLTFLYKTLSNLKGLITREKKN